MPSAYDYVALRFSSCRSLILLRIDWLLTHSRYRLPFFPVASTPAETMFSSLTTKLALKKVGLPSDTFDLSSWTLPPADPQQPRREPNKLRKPMPEGYDPNNPDDSWGSWFAGGIGLPLTVHPWLSPAPPPVKVAAVPSVGDLAPVDREGRLRLGGGQRTLVVFLRCVGCACTSSLIPIPEQQSLIRRSRPEDLPHPPDAREPLRRHDPLRRRLPLLRPGDPQMDRPPRRRLVRRGHHRRGPFPVCRLGAGARQRLAHLPPGRADPGLEGEGLARGAGRRGHTEAERARCSQGPGEGEQL